jgi:flagellar biosynthesis/type III secretory pathway M-ring protein FliF/YscJ
VCIFAVQVVVCGNITGNVSDPISIPVYASEQPAPSSLSPRDNPVSYNLDPTKTVTSYLIENQGTHNLESTETVGMHSQGINTEFVTSIGLLATALMVCVVVFIIVTSIILIRSKAKIKAALQQSASQGETMNMEPMYEDITAPLPSASAITTQDNVAYGHAQATTAR